MFYNNNNNKFNIVYVYAVDSQLISNFYYYYIFFIHSTSPIFIKKIFFLVSRHIFKFCISALGSHHWWWFFPNFFFHLAWNLHFIRRRKKLMLKSQTIFDYEAIFHLFHIICRAHAVPSNLWFCCFFSKFNFFGHSTRFRRHHWVLSWTPQTPLCILKQSQNAQNSRNNNFRSFLIDMVLACLLVCRNLLYGSQWQRFALISSNFVSFLYLLVAMKHKLIILQSPWRPIRMIKIKSDLMCSNAQLPVSKKTREGKKSIFFHFYLFHNEYFFTLHTRCLSNERPFNLTLIWGWVCRLPTLIDNFTIFHWIFFSLGVRSHSLFSEFFS